MAKSKPVNELDHILRYLRAHGFTMRQIAQDLKLDYDYLKGQKSQKDPAKQSKSLIEMVRTRYADILKNIPPYDGVKPYKADGNADQAWKEDKTIYNNPGNEDYRGQEDKNSELLHEIHRDLKVIRENQKKSFALERARIKYIAKRDANGDKQRQKDIIEEIERDADAYNADTDAQGPSLPDGPAS